MRHSNDGTVWRDTVYTTPPKPCASCSQLRSALAAEQQHSAALQEQCAGYQDDNAQLYAKLSELQEENDALRKEVEAYKSQSYVGMSEYETKESMREYLGFSK
jgi:septal ring factor EnvC (AmiA/AmiB activator)